MGAVLFTSTVPQSSGQSSFPKIENSRDVTITLQRAGGMGAGPTYRLTISGDGRVTYEGKAGVFIRGQRTSRLSQDAIRELVEEFRKAHFFDLNDNYRSAATDLPTCITTFQAGTLRKRVVDYGVEIDRVAPEALIHLEKRIDEIANTRRWTQGSLFRRMMHWR